MRITGVRTYLVDARPDDEGSWVNWLFLRVDTDAGIHGYGECWGWPRVVQTAIDDLQPLLIGEDSRQVAMIWQKLYNAITSHGHTGVVGAGALTGIEMALWDLAGKALGVPVWSLLGGKVRDRLRVYGHAFDDERARYLVEHGFTAMKVFCSGDCVARVAGLRREYGQALDLMVDVGGPPWQTAADAIALGGRLESHHLLFYEDPVDSTSLAPMRKVAAAVDLPLAIGEKHAFVHSLLPFIAEGLVDVVQPDNGRFGGLLEMQKLAVLADEHGVLMAPHQGSLGPVAEAAAVQLLATVPNFLIHEYLVDHSPFRRDLMSGGPELVDGHLVVPDGPGLGIELNEELLLRHPGSAGAFPSAPDDEEGYQHRAARRRRGEWLAG